MNIQNINNKIYGTKNLNEGEYAKSIFQTIDQKIDLYSKFYNFNTTTEEAEEQIKF